MCPQCGSADQVHSIEEWAAMAQANRGFQWQPGAPMPGYSAQPNPQPGYGPAPQPGYAPAPPPGPAPQSGFPDPSHQQSGFPDPSQYQQSGFPDPSHYQQPGTPGGSPQPPPGPADPQPTYQAGPRQPAAGSRPPPSSQQPGYQGGPPPAQPPGYQAGPQPDVLAGPESWQSQPPRRSRSWDSGSAADTFEDAIGEAVLGAATKAIGRVIGRKMRQAYNERIVPAMAARQESVLNERMAIAERHPDLRACLRDQVVFLVGGTRVLPLARHAVRTRRPAPAPAARLTGSALLHHRGPLPTGGNGPRYRSWKERDHGRGTRWWPRLRAGCAPGLAPSQSGSGRARAGGAELAEAPRVSVRRSRPSAAGRRPGRPR